MRRSKLTDFLIIILFLSLGSTRNGSVSARQQDRLSTAIDWFKEGSFDKALPLFTKLCFDLPYDYLVKYYYGACLVETGTFGLEAEKNLVLASSNEVPVKVYYYLGKMFHGRGDFNSALRFYNRYKNNATTDEIAETHVDDLIQMCFKQVNQFTVQKADSVTPAVSRDIKLAADTLNKDVNVHTAVAEAQALIKTPEDSAKMVISMPEKNDTARSDGTLNVLAEHTGMDSVKSDSSKRILTEQILKPEPIKFIEFPINDKVTYLVEDMFHVDEARKEFKSGAGTELLLDSLLQVVQDFRKTFHQTFNPKVRDSLASRIAEMEARNLELKAEVNLRYGRSRALEQEWWSKADYTSFEAYNRTQDSLIKLREIQLHPVVVPDTLHVGISDSLKVIVTPDTINVAPEKRPDGEVIYKIQIGAFNKGIPVQRKLMFDRLAKIRTIEKMVVENGVTLYTTGNLKVYEDALKLQSQVRMEGIKDAFVIAVKDGKKIKLPVDHTPQQK